MRALRVSETGGIEKTSPCYWFPDACAGRAICAAEINLKAGARENASLLSIEEAREGSSDGKGARKTTDENPLACLAPGDLRVMVHLFEARERELDSRSSKNFEKGPG